MSDDFGAAAAAIGDEIVASAIWHEDRCTWVGAAPEEGPDGRIAIMHAALGPDLYGGTAGVALFLAELHALTGDDGARRTAVGALEHALARVDEIPLAAALGLYGGGVGIALAAARAGVLLGDDGLVERAAELVRTCVPGTEDEAEYDLVSGRAGAVAGLVVLARLLADESLLEPAVRVGDELLRTAADDGSTLSWRSPTIETAGNLTGFSHGAAGVAYALLELGTVTGERRFVEAGERAFAYERSLYDPLARNWPDLRHHDGNGGGHSFAAFWCHGAPGIALSRLRALELLGGDDYAREASAALATTSGSVEAMLASQTANFSLCHGLAGNAEVLAESRVASEAAAETVLRVASFGIDEYASRSGPWPCGTHGGETPGLFLGLAGIGHFYLRLSDPAVPSLLLPRAEAFALQTAVTTG